MGFEAAGAAIAEWWVSLGAVGQLVVRLVILAVASKALSRRAGGAGAIGGVLASQGRNLSVRQPIAPWQVVIGQARVGGSVTFMFLGADKKYLHVVVTLACHVSEEIGDIWLDDEVITPAMLNANGEVTSGKFARYDQTARHETTSGTSLNAAYPVASVQGVVAVVDTSDGGSETVQYDEVPSGPGQQQWSRSGDVFTFGSTGLPGGFIIHVDYTESVFVPVTRIKKSLGGEAGQPFADLVSESEGKWTDAHRQTGHTKIYIRFQTSHLEAGAPNISAVLKGLKLYDPRTATTSWSANPALAVLAYLTSTDFGLGAALSEMGSAEFIAAANVAEERVLLAAATADFTADPATDAIALLAGSKPPQIGDGVRVASTGTLPAGLAAATTYYAFYAAGLLKLATSYANALAGTPIDITTAGSGTHTLTYYDEPRYRANGAFQLSERPVDILERLLASMTGMLAQVSDSWRVFAGAYEAATLTLTAGDFAGPIQIEPMPPRDKWANAAKGVFVNPASNWQPTDFPVIAPTAAYLAEDGGETIYADLDLSSFVTSSSQAQRIARIEIRRRRSGLSITALFKLTAWRTFTGHTVAITFQKYGWTAKEFVILDASFAVIQNQEEGPALGVQLVLRETNAAIFSWSAEDLLQGTPPSTSLPNPFSVAAPGAPAVVETLYQTTGSAGVKSRAMVSWTAVVDPLVKSYELSWKNIADSAYQIATVPQGTSYNIDDLDAGLYLFAVRSWNGIVRSAWSPYTTKELIGLSAPPSDILNFAVQSYSGQAKFTWEKLSSNSDLDVTIGGRVFVRYSPKTVGATWNDGTLVNPDGYPGDTSIGFGPLTTGTYMAKAMDSSGNVSVNAATFVVTEAVLTALTIIATVTESPGFTGTKINVARIDSAIQLDGTTLIDSMTALIDSWGSIDSLGGVQGTGSYSFASKLDLGSVQAARLISNIDSLAYSVDDLIDSRIDPIDSWTSIDGAVIEDAEVQLMIRVTNDDPNGAPTWGPFHALGQVGDYNARGFEFRLDFATGNATHNRKVTTLSVAAKH